VLREGASASVDDLRDHLADRFPSWWLPDRYEFVESIPRTSTGKFDKLSLRESYDDLTLGPGEES
jgi:fatty-acyl-CoA synthase